MAGLNFPVAAIRQQTASSLEILVQLARLNGGKRKVLAVSEITGMEGDTICLQDIFVFRQTGLDEKGAAKGYFEACGVRPRILDRLRERGAELPEHLFQRRQLASWSAHAAQANRAGGNGHVGGTHGRH